MVIKVAVIGCGAAGLCALRHLTSRPDEFEAVGFEQLPQPGGTWVYTEEVGLHAKGLPFQSSMYKNLRTNLPKEVMAFPDFPFPDNLPSYLKREDVLAYLQSYCDRHNLSRYIKYETKVDLVEPLIMESNVKWRVSYSSVPNLEAKDVINVDAVMVCNGHHEIPRIPSIPGTEEFQGTILHSHDYREPEIFKDQTVVCLGAASSGQDISLDLATVAKKVIISHNKPIRETVLPHNVCQKPGIARLGKDSVMFKDGEKEKIDTLMLCTGYRYNFPFLDKTCSLQIEDQRLPQLYKHIVYADFPTLSFIGVCNMISPFPQFDCQVQFVLSALNGSHMLPSKEDMKREIQEDFQAMLKDGLPPRYAHALADRQWAYNDELARLGQFKPIPRIVQTLFDEALEKRKMNISTYKTKNYSIVNGTFIEI